MCLDELSHLAILHVHPLTVLIQLRHLACCQNLKIVLTSKMNPLHTPLNLKSHATSTH